MFLNNAIFNDYYDGVFISNFVITHDPQPLWTKNDPLEVKETTTAKQNLVFCEFLGMAELSG
ncbi:hypothetical protein KAM481_15110 [Aeromonas caviae]|nr:hypothetical protein KAM481_15110 [Aeromonas caviae]